MGAKKSSKKGAAKKTSRKKSKETSVLEPTPFASMEGSKEFRKEIYKIPLPVGLGRDLYGCDQRPETTKYPIIPVKPGPFGLSLDSHPRTYRCAEFTQYQSPSPK